MKIYAIRHSSVNVMPGICYGQTDVEVADSFAKERDVLFNQLKSTTISLVYSSPLKRCRLLAESLFPICDIVFDSRLKELNFGDWEMKPWDDIYCTPYGKVWMDNYQKLPTLNGESYPEMEARIQNFLFDLKKTVDADVAIIAHAGVIRIFKSIIENVPVASLFENFKPSYGSLTVFEF